MPLNYPYIFFTHAPLAIVALDFERVFFHNIEFSCNLLVVGYANRILAFHNIGNHIRSFYLYFFLDVIILYYVYSCIRRNNRNFVDFILS